MYSVILAALLTTTADQSEGLCWGRWRPVYTSCSCSCTCHGVTVVYGCSGCHGCHGYYGCSGCHGCWGSYQTVYYSNWCTGCYGSWCSGGCYGGWSYYGSCSCSCSCSGYSTMTYAVPATSVAVSPYSQPATLNPAPVTPPPVAAPPAVAPKVAPAIPGFVPPPAVELKPQARVTLRVPEQAQVWVDGVLCPLTGETRSFNTASLEAGHQYFYTVTVEVPSVGRESRRVLLTPGQTTEADFRAMVSTPVQSVAR